MNTNDFEYILKKEYKIFALGNTGSGKSTILNFLLNN